MLYFKNIRKRIQYSKSESIGFPLPSPSFCFFIHVRTQAKTAQLRRKSKLGTVLKIKRYEQRLTQWYSVYGGSGWWAPDVGIFKPTIRHFQISPSYTLLPPHPTPSHNHHRNLHTFCFQSQLQKEPSARLFTQRKCSLCSQGIRPKKHWRTKGEREGVLVRSWLKSRTND